MRLEEVKIRFKQLQSVLLRTSAGVLIIDSQLALVNPRHRSVDQGKVRPGHAKRGSPLIEGEWINE